MKLRKTCGKVFPFPYQLKRHEKTHVNKPLKLERLEGASSSQAEVEILAAGALPDLSQFR